MLPTLVDGDVCVVIKPNNIKRFDIVTIAYEDHFIVKRVIGLPGETITLHDNVITVNGDKLNQNFTYYKVYMDDFTIDIPEDNYFVLGDNRGLSLDSRVAGTFEREAIIYRVLVWTHAPKLVYDLLIALIGIITLTVTMYRR